MRLPSFLRASAASALAYACLAFASCGGGGSEAPAAVRLAQGFRPRAIQARTPWTADRSSEVALTLEPSEDGGLWIESQLSGADWTALEGGFHAAPRTVHLPPSDTPSTLTRNAEAARFIPVEVALEAPDTVRPGDFGTGGARVILRLNPGELPGPATLREHLPLGRDRDGTWRVHVGPLHADGIPVLAGTREEIRCDVPPASVLSFAFAAKAFGQQTELTYRALLDGETLVEGRLELGSEFEHVRHSVELPRDGRDDARIAFEVDGPPALGLFLTPLFAPREATRTAPDLLLFLADTFRADNLAFYGGNPELTPHLNRFAEESVRFQRSWSSGAWTLPTHATLFSGMLPRQSGVRGDLDALSEDAITLAEELQAAGYRTVAITDAAFVSARHGLDQGFEWFFEDWESLELTLERTNEVLDVEDPRPLFLFVHTYRAHTPYVATQPTRERLLGIVDIGADYDDLVESTLDIPRYPTPGWTPSDAQRGHMDAFEALYRGGAADVDVGFEALRQRLERDAFFESGFLLFTSDHGEAFWEHGDVGHGGPLFEEHVRVPLLIHGSGLAPRTEHGAATTLDLPRTIAALAGIESPTAWGGSDLLAEGAPDRAVFSFQCLRDGGASAVAVIEGARKLVARPPDRESTALHPEAAFDMEADPLEASNVLSEAPWTTPFFQGHQARLAEVLTPVIAPASATGDAASRAQLEALGYVGD